MTNAAQKFLDAVEIAWDSATPWEATAELGLSGVDADALMDFCDKSGENYDQAEAEVLACVEQKVKTMHADAEWRSRQRAGGPGIVL